ncbi:hypothetical protein D3C78_1428270 [compost metagenome]
MGGGVAAGESRAGQGHHGNAHQEGFTGSQATRVGPGIEGDVDAVVGLQQLPVRRWAFDQQALGCNALCGHDGAGSQAQIFTVVLHTFE